MTVDPRAALDRFVAALEAHYLAVSARRGEQDSSVDDAYDILADAFDVYAEAIGRAYNEALPFDITDEEDLEDEDSPEGYVEDKVPDEAFEDEDDEDLEDDDEDDDEDDEDLEDEDAR